MGCLVEVARYECVLCVGVDEIGVGRCVQNRAWEYIEVGVNREWECEVLKRGRCDGI
jgi:hypothetical protein